MVACDEHSTLMEDYATVTLKCEGLEAEIDNLRETLIAQQHRQHTHNTVVLKKNRGRPLDELSPRQARRKLQDFKANAESVLWFAESFGMIPTELHLKRVPTGIPVTIPLSSSQSTDTANGPSSSRSTNTASSPSTENGNDDRNSLLQVNYMPNPRKLCYIHTCMQII